MEQVDAGQERNHRLPRASMILNKAAELQYGRLPQLQKQLESEEANVKNKDLSLVREK